jgi:hypothetical protein
MISMARVAKREKENYNEMLEEDKEDLSFN